MGLRFQKRVRLLPGIWLNLSRGGVSVSLGAPGATVNVGSQGVRGTVGVPGTGLSYSQRLTSAPRAEYDRIAREMEQHREREAALAEHERHEARLRALRDILRDRARAPFATDAVDPRWADRLTTASSTRDFAPSAELLVAELANEEVPVPLVFELELQDSRHVAIACRLPDLGVIPEHTTSITRAGKLSTRKSSDRVRRQLHLHVAAALILRIAHETFRVVPGVDSIALTGFVMVRERLTGHSHEETLIELAMSRTAFVAVDLDQADPVSALVGLGGTIHALPRQS